MAPRLVLKIGPPFDPHRFAFPSAPWPETTNFALTCVSVSQSSLLPFVFMQ